MIDIFNNIVDFFGFSDISTVDVLRYALSFFVVYMAYKFIRWIVRLIVK